MNIRFLSLSLLTAFPSIHGFGEEKVGPCRGPGGVNDKVNSRAAIETTQAACQEACVDLEACVGYAYCSNCNGGECILYGPGVDGSCTDPSALNEPDCEALGRCSITAASTEGACGTCSESTASTQTLCGVVDGEWTAATWTSANEVWTDAEDPWTGHSHHSTIIAGTTDEASSNYVCVDANAEDHMAHCVSPVATERRSLQGSSVHRSLETYESSCYDMGVHQCECIDEKCGEKLCSESGGYWSNLCPGSCTCTPGASSPCHFNGLVEDDRTDDNCPDVCTFIPKPKPPKSSPPHAGDIKLPGWDAAMSGACRGGPQHTDKVNGKYSNTAGADGKLSQQECADACLAEPMCIGYAQSTAWCIVYGPEIHSNAVGEWTADNHEVNYISGTKANPSYICVTGPPRKEEDTGAPEKVTPYVAKKDQDGDDDAGGLSTGAIAAIGVSVGFVAVGAVLFILTSTTKKAGPIHEEQAGDQFNEA
mmetsp:Transcript_14444/g.21507  ORF Transcript_14444/g.21507 Transcript_14444/m.21507 type:complete len:479 (-) Transcript_14444:420-1856(-)